MTCTDSRSYPLGGTSTERDCLLDQAEQYEPTANWLLDQIGVQPGWRAVDIGCGPIGILNLLSQRVGPSGAVIGLEREPRFVDMARAEIAKRGLGNVTHGTSATLTMCLDRYAEVFCNAGLAVLLYDHRNFGLSGGEPRQLINPWLHARCYR